MKTQLANNKLGINISFFLTTQLMETSEAPLQIHEMVQIR